MNLIYFGLGILAAFAGAKLWRLWIPSEDTQLIAFQEDLVAALLCLLIQQAESAGSENENDYNPQYWLYCAKQILEKVEKEKELDDKISY